ncbi:MAG: arylamine N-acetyltransferase [Candidatus Krumholzibacteriota bacterium]|nr:arylamine N-acetyltransferase [Candidatus Krumholzibacteriota bacterium]
MSEQVKTARDLFYEHFRIPSSGEADLDMLRTMVSHFSHLPYENLTKIIKKFSGSDPQACLRDPAEVIRGYIEDNTGGTCFSLTWCLGSILSGAGFRCYPVMADMRQPNIHCALVVLVKETRYIVDPGYLLGEPVPLAGKPVTLPTPFGMVQLRPRGLSSYDLYTQTGDQRKWRYRVRTAPVSQAQFLKYWIRSFSLPGMNSLQLTRLTRQGHLYIRDHHLRLRQEDKKINENIRQDLEARIEKEFGIPGEITARAREEIERMKSRWRTSVLAAPGQGRR